MRTTARIILAGVISTLCLTVATSSQTASAGKMPVYCCR
jgi:hypothetical protein